MTEKQAPYGEELILDQPETCERETCGEVVKPCCGNCTSMVIETISIGRVVGRRSVCWNSECPCFGKPVPQDFYCNLHEPKEEK